MDLGPMPTKLNIRIVCAYCGTQKKNAFVQCPNCGAADTKVIDGNQMDRRQVRPVANVRVDKL